MFVCHMFPLYEMVFSKNYYCFMFLRQAFKTVNSSLFLDEGSRPSQNSSRTSILRLLTSALAMRIFRASPRAIYSNKCPVFTRFQFPRYISQDTVSLKFDIDVLNRNEKVHSSFSRRSFLYHLALL